MSQTGKRMWDVEKGGAAPVVSVHCVHCQQHCKNTTPNSKEPYCENLHPAESVLMGLSVNLALVILASPEFLTDGGNRNNSNILLMFKSTVLLLDSSLVDFILCL